MHSTQNKSIEQYAQWRLDQKRNFLDLIEIMDSFDQLGRLAVILDQLYQPTDPEHKELFKALEKIARHLRDLRAVGDQVAVPACAAEHCPCPFPCRPELESEVSRD